VARTASELDIENTEALLAYLRATGRLGPGDDAICTPLGGGVSNRTVRVEQTGRFAWVLKQALPKLRVKEDWFSDPARIHREALGLAWLGRLAPAGSVPALVFEDHEQFLLGMEAVPMPHENWKAQLLRGVVVPTVVEQFGALLGRVHEESRLRRQELKPLFGDRSFFETLRLEPYYRFVVRRSPSLAPFLEDLIAETLAVQVSLVHGDYSPKNVLVRDDRIVLLDHEVIHFGDPAFDLGFAMAHLLSKALHVTGARAALLQAGWQFWQAYETAAPVVCEAPGLRGRAVRHAVACLLARVDGRSPLEYFSAAEQEWQRTAARALAAKPPADVPCLVEAWSECLSTTD